MEKLELFKVRNFGEVISDIFIFVKLNFKSLAINLAIFGLPLLVVGGYFSFIAQQATQSLQQSLSFNFTNMIMYAGIGTTLQYTSYLFIMIVVFSTMKFYQENPKEEKITTSHIVKDIKEHIFPLLGLNIGLVIIVMFGFLLLIIPGIYLAILLSLAVPACFFERANLVEAFSRSRKLISENWWFTLGIFLIIGIISFSLTVLFQIPAFMLTISNTFTPFGINLQLFALPITLVSSAASIILISLAYVTVGILYFSFREEKEGAGLLQKIETIGTTNPNESPFTA